MNKRFADEFETLLKELTGELQFYHPPTGENIAPQVMRTIPVPPDQLGQVDGEYPMICWVDYVGEESGKPHPVEILIDFGIKVDERVGTVAEQNRAGSDALDEILEKLRGLKNTNRRRVGGYRLQLPFKWIKGDQSPGFEGVQPRPYYHGRLYLKFLPM